LFGGEQGYKNKVDGLGLGDVCGVGEELLKPFQNSITEKRGKWE